MDHVGSPEVLTYHAVDTPWLPGRLRGIWRWQDLAYVVKRNPELRRHFTLNVFWKPAHVWFPIAVAGLFLSRRRPRLALMALPWVIHALPHHGSAPRGRFRSLAELPGRGVIDLAELLTLAWGSIKHRTLFL